MAKEATNEKDAHVGASGGALRFARHDRKTRERALGRALVRQRLIRRA